ncbi:MAG: BlaI/MecI/CopY family transcriptional regulator [Bacteroidales bacterium]|nr:BlaI/MecI/CopY family transcriptional regulator [Bacteroidales bacterium]
MQNKEIAKPTEAELEILQILWKQGASTVRSVNEEMNQKRKVGMTTTLKIIQIMTEKGILKRDDSKRPAKFIPLVDEAQTQSLLIDKLLSSAFGGSAFKMVMQALGNHKSSEDEMQKIKELIDQMEKGK